MAPAIVFTRSPSFAPATSPSTCLARVSSAERRAFPDFRLTLPFGIEHVVDALAAQFPAEADGIAEFFALRDQIFREASQLPHAVDIKDLDAAAARFPTFFRYRGE